jgi:orotate phosphoribosyltransferase
MDQKIKLQLQQENLALLVKNGGFAFTDKFFLYTSGQIGPYFVQSIDITKRGSDYAKTINSLIKLIYGYIGLDKFDIISGGETRDWDFSNPIAVKLVKPHAKLYKDKAPIGAEIKGKKVLHIADLNNVGSSIRDYWMPWIRKSGGELTDVLFYVDRMEEGTSEIANLGLKSHTLIPLDGNSWQFLLNQNVINIEIYRSLNERLEDKTTWAHNMLRNNPEHLRVYLENNSTRKKALKVINVGYPEIKDEMISKLKQIGYRGDF